MSDFMESIFDSVSIIVDKKLEELAFDTTVICRIVDDSNSKNGKYKVTDGSITFEVYSESSEYKSGESVRVTIPNNDYSQKKFITGKYVEGEEENNAPITYVSQTDSVVNVSGNLIDWDNEIKTTEIIMNGPESNVLVWKKDFEEELKYLQNSEIYNTLLLKADFQTFMDNYQIIEGTYGLSVELFIYIPEIKEFIRKTAIFSNSEMFGNTYSFKIPSTQSKVFPLTITEGFIRGIKISLYQGNDFKDQKGQIEYLKDPQTEETIYPQVSHIKINDLQLGFGSNVTGVADNVLQIYSPNSLDYKYYLHTDVTNRKKIELVWYNKNEFDKYLGFSDGYYDPTYDEIEYLKIAKIDSRLVEQQQEENVPSDKCGLWLAADIAELDTLTTKIGTMITGDLYQRLSDLNNKIQDISTHGIPIDSSQPAGENNTRFINTQLNELITTISTGNKVEPIKNQFKLDQELYKKLLECVNQKKAYKIWGTNDEGKEVEKNIDLTAFTLPDLNRFSGEYINILDEVNDILETLQTDLSVYFSSYLGVYDQAKIRINWVISEIKKILNKFPKVNILNSYPTDDIHKYEDITYQDYLLYYTYKEQKKFPENKPANILDILFKKEIEKGETEPNLPDYLQMNLDAYNQKYCIYWYKYNSGYQTSDDYSFLGENWQRLSTIYKIEVDDDPSPIMNPIFNDKGNNTLNEYMDPDMQEQKYKAVLFYDHVMYASNELVFTNLDEIPNTIAIDKADGLQIEHLENSFDSYFLYSGSSNNLCDVSQASKTRQLRCHFDGLKLGDELLYGARIYWYIPESSMLVYNKDWLVDDQGFSTDLDELEETKKLSPYHRPGYVFFSKVIQDKSNIVSEEDQSSENDTSLETDSIVDESFMRDEGTGQCDTRDFWYQISNSYEPTGKTHIICMVNPKGSEIYYETKLQFSFGLMGTNGTHHTLSVINKGLCPAVRKPSGIADDGSLTLKVELRDVNNEKIDVSLIDSNQNFVSVEKVFQSCAGFPVIYNAAYDGYSSILEDNELKLIPDRNNPSSAIIRVSLKDYKVEEGKKVSLSSIHPIPWSQDHYYLSGTTRIVYNSLGVLDTNAQFDREYHLYKVSDDTEVKVNTGELDEFGNEKTDHLNWRVRLYNSKGEEIVAGNPLYNQYISFAPKIDCQKQWVEVTLNLEDIVQIFNTINLDESKLQLHIDDEQYKQLLLYYEGLQSYFIWDDANGKWKFNGDQSEYQLMVNLIQIETVETILNNIETNLGDRPIISVNDYNVLISYYKPWEDYFIFKKEQNKYECISSLSTLEAMKKLEESKPNNQVKQILTNIGNLLKANPIISTKDYNTLVHHNVSWSTYFDEVKNYKCFANIITSSDGQPSTLEIMKQAAAGNSDVINILNMITESNPIIDEKSYSILITFNSNWTTWFDNCWEYTQGHTVLNEMKNTVKVINKVVEQEINNTSLLVPSPMYCQGLGSECFIIVEGFYKNKQTNIETIYWQQPIIILQNQHESSLLNQWNGDFVIDEENKYIMSAMLGAGYKNPDNTYNGVLMGDLAITELLDTSNSARSVESRMVGLYGFHEGAQSFGFRVDGTAFIGKAGAGRIEFNGNKGIIQSGNYIASKGKMGMQIDLTNGHIDAYNFKLTSNRVIINSEEQPYFQIRSSGDDTEDALMEVGNNSYYLQSSNYDATAINKITWSNIGTNSFNTQIFPKGTRLDMQNGTLYTSLGSANTLTINQGAYSGVVLAAGDNFALMGSGDLRLKGNWEFLYSITTNEEGTIIKQSGLSPFGVYSNQKMKDDGTFENKNKNGLLATIEDEDWTNWDEIAAASKKFRQMGIQGTLNSLLSLAANATGLLGLLGAGGALAGIAALELQIVALSERVSALESKP